MKRKEGSTDFAKLIAEAEKSVSNVKDDQLRNIAFERVLNHLLAVSAKVETSYRQGHSKSRIANVTNAEIRAKTPTGPLAWLSELHEEGFFKEPKSLKDILLELNNRSHILKSTDLTWPLQKLSHDKKLRRNKQNSSGGDSKVFHWYNW